MPSGCNGASADEIERLLLAENGRDCLGKKSWNMMVSAVPRRGRPLPLMVQIALQVSVQHKSPDLSNCRKERKVLQF